MSRYDANVNVTIEIPDEEAFLEENRDVDDEPIAIEEAIAQAIESDQPTFELSLGTASGFMVAAENVSLLD